jgi:hypothetical protein
MSNIETLNPIADQSQSPLVSFLRSVKIDKIKNFTKDRSEWEIISSFDIVSPDFAKTGESRMMSLSINESLFTPFVSGHIDVLDRLDWVGQFNISGNELLTVEFGFVDTTEIIKYEFFICNAKIINNFAEINAPKLGTTEKAIVYRLEFLSDEIFNTQFNKSLLDFDKDFIGYIAKDENNNESIPGLVNEISRKLNLFPIEIESTKNGIWLKNGEISLPNGVPQGQINLASLMSYITNYAVPKDNPEAPNYFFWKDKNGWHFKSLEKLLKDQENSDAGLIFDLNSEDYADFSRVLNVEVSNQKDTLTLFQNHAFMSHYIKTDPNYKNLYSDFLSSKSGFTYSIVDYNYHRDFSKVKHIEEYKLISESVDTNPIVSQQSSATEDITFYTIPNTLLRDNVFGFYNNKTYNTPFQYNIHYSTDIGFGSMRDNQAIIWWDYLDREKDSRWSNVAWQPQFDITELEIKKLHTIQTKIREPLKEKREEFVRLKNLKREWEVYRCVVCCSVQSVGGTADNEIFTNPLGITNPDEYSALFGKNGIFGGEQDYSVVAAGSFTDVIDYDVKNDKIQNGLTLSIDLLNPNFTVPPGVNQEDYNPNAWYKESIGQFFNLKNNIQNYVANVIERGVSQYNREILNLQNKIVDAESFLENVQNYITQANSWIESRLLPCCSSSSTQQPVLFSNFIGDSDSSQIGEGGPSGDFSYLCNSNDTISQFIIDFKYLYGYYPTSIKGPDDQGNATRDFIQQYRIEAKNFADPTNWGYVMQNNSSNSMWSVQGETTIFYETQHNSQMDEWSCNTLWWVNGGAKTNVDSGSVYDFYCPRGFLEGPTYDDRFTQPRSETPWTNSIYGAPAGSFNPIKRCCGSAVACGWDELDGEYLGNIKPNDSDYQNFTLINGGYYPDYYAGNDGTQGIQQYITNSLGIDTTTTFTDLKCGAFHCYGPPGSSPKWTIINKNKSKNCSWQSTSGGSNGYSSTQCYDYYNNNNGIWENIRKNIETRINSQVASCGKTVRLLFNGSGGCVRAKTRNLEYKTPIANTEKNIPGPGPLDTIPYGKQYTNGKPCDETAEPTLWEIQNEFGYFSNRMPRPGNINEETIASCERCSQLHGLWYPHFSLFVVGGGSGNDQPIDICQEGGSACLKQGCTDTLTGSVFSREPSACIGFNYVDGLGEVPLLVLPPGQCMKCNNFLEGATGAPGSDDEFDSYNCCNCSAEQRKTFTPLPEWAKECSREKFMNAIAQFIGTEDRWYYNYGFTPGGGAAFADIDDYIGPNGDKAVTRKCLELGDCYNKLCFNPLYLEVEARRAKQEIKILNAQIKLLEYTRDIVQQGIVQKFNDLYEEWWNRKAFFYSTIPGKNVFTDVSTGLTGSIVGGRTGPIRSKSSLYNIKSIKKKSIRGSRYELLARSKGITGATLGEWLYNFAWGQPAQNQTVSPSGTKHPYYSQKYQSPFVTQRQLYKNYNYEDSNPLNNFPFNGYGEQPYSPNPQFCLNNIWFQEKALVSLPESQLPNNVDAFVLNTEYGDTTQRLIAPDALSFSNTFNIFDIKTTSVPANLKKEQLSTYIRIEFSEPIGLDRIVDFPNGFIRDAGTEYFLPYLVSLTAGPTGRQTIRNNVVVIGMDPYGFDVAVKKTKVSDEETDKQYHWWEDYRNLNDTSLTNNGMDLWPEVGFETSYPYYTADPKGWWWKSSWYHGEELPDVDNEQLNTFDWFQRSADVDPEYKESAHGSGYLQYSYRKVKPHRSWWSFHIPKNIFIPQKLFAVLSKKFGAKDGDSSGYIGNLFAYKYQDYYWWYGDELDRWMRLTKEGAEALEELKVLSVQSADYFADTSLSQPLSNHAFVHTENSLEETGHGAIEKYFHQTTLHWLYGDYLLYKPGLVTQDVWKYDLTGETDYGLVSPKTMAPNYDVFDDNFSAQFIVFSRKTDLCSKFTCANPDGPVSNAACPKTDPYCNCPAKEHIPKQAEPSYLELYRKYKEIKECDLIAKNLGEQYLGCLWSDPMNPCSCKCPEVGAKFTDYMEYTRTYATFWDTPRKTPLTRKALMNQFGSQMITIQIVPLSKVNIGDIITIKQGVTVGGLPLLEKNLSGRWLVAEINNGFYKDANQSMTLTLVRDTLSRDPDYSLPELSSILDVLF